MKKKQYVLPSLRARLIIPANFICGSGGETSSGGNSGQTIGSGNTAKGMSRSFDDADNLGDDKSTNNEWGKVW